MFTGHEQSGKQQPAHMELMDSGGWTNRKAYKQGHLRWGQKSDAWVLGKGEGRGKGALNRERSMCKGPEVGSLV